jgi:hypothetical protein
MIRRIVRVLVTAAAIAVPVLAKASPARLSVRQSSARRHSAGSPANRIHRAEPASLTSKVRTILRPDRSRTDSAQLDEPLDEHRVRGIRLSSQARADGLHPIALLVARHDPWPAATRPKRLGGWPVDPVQPGEVAWPAAQSRLVAVRADQVRGTGTGKCCRRSSKAGQVRGELGVGMAEHALDGIQGLALPAGAAHHGHLRRGVTGPLRRGQPGPQCRAPLRPGPPCRPAGSRAGRAGTGRPAGPRPRPRLRRRESRR